MSTIIQTDVEIAAAQYRAFFEEAEKIVERSREVWKDTPKSENDMFCKFFIFR